MVTTQRDCPLRITHRHAYHQPHPELHAFPEVLRELHYYMSVLLVHFSVEEWL